MKKLIMSALFIMFLSGSVYAEKYIAILHDFKQVADPVGFDSQNRIQFVKTLKGRIIQVIMDINKDGEKLSGNIIITDGVDKPEFIITDGIIKGDNVRIKAVLAEGSALGSFDYIGKGPYAEKVGFILNGQQNAKNGDLFLTADSRPPFTIFFNGEEINFEKYTRKTESYIKEYIKQFKDNETVKIKKAVETKNYYEAMRSLDMLAAFDINPGKKLQKEADSMKEYYEKELPKKIAAETIFSDIKIERIDPEIVKLTFNMDIGRVWPVAYMGYRIYISENEVFERGENISRYYFAGKHSIYKEENINLQGRSAEGAAVKIEVTSVLMMPYPEYFYGDRRFGYMAQRTIKKDKSK